MHIDKTCRIISGKYRHRQIQIPNKIETRPSKDRVREALFSMIEPLVDKTFLDLFAGSGAIGIEALSRGASLAVFVDAFRPACECVRANLKLLNVNQQNYMLLSADASIALEQLFATKMRFDYVFLDPPYKYDEQDFIHLFELMENYKILDEHAVIIVETNQLLSDKILHFQRFKEKKYSQTYLLLYRKNSLNAK